MAARSSFQSRCPICSPSRAHQGSCGCKRTPWLPMRPPHPVESHGSWIETDQSERAGCWSRALPCRHALGFPNPQEARPAGALQQASFSLCKALGSFLFLCILLAILHPVWEFQEHLRLSFAQRHMCEPKGSIMFLPARALSLAVNFSETYQTLASNHTCGILPPCLIPLRPKAQRPSPLSCSEKLRGPRGLV